MRPPRRFSVWLNAPARLALRAYAQSRNMIPSEVARLFLALGIGWSFKDALRENTVMATKRAALQAAVVEQDPSVDFSRPPAGHRSPEEASESPQISFRTTPELAQGFQTWAQGQGHLKQADAVKDALLQGATRQGVAL